MTLTFLGVPLSKEEEHLLTGVIVRMANGQKITESDVLHELLFMANSHHKVECSQRELRKLRHSCESKTDELSLGKYQAYNEALDLLN